MSIALTLAARCHASDLAHHGTTDPQTWHVGSDGGSATQRVTRFGTGLGGPGTTQEIIVAVVRPADLQLSPTDILGFALVDDGCPSRENREALLRPVASTSASGAECCGIGHAIALCGEDTCVEVFVVLFVASTYTDKSVAQMAAAQFNSLQTCAASFLEGQRVVSKAVARSKKDLYRLTNITIGRRSEGLRPERLERLAAKRVHTKPPVADDEEATFAPKILQRRASKRKSQQSAASDKDEIAAATQEEEDNNEEEEANQLSANKRRLSSFFQRYAPERVAVVDAALALHEGREGEMFEKLQQKYGPEPTPSNSPAELSRSHSRDGDGDGDGEIPPLPQYHHQPTKATSKASMKDRHPNSVTAVSDTFALSATNDDNPHEDRQVEVV